MAYTNIDDPSAYFQATTYTGTYSSGNSITNSGNSDLQPDMVWIKVRTYNNPHIIQDTSRGFAGNGEVNLLVPNTTGAEATNGAFESFDSNGFTVGGTNPLSRAYNGSSDSYIAWQWKANGGTTSSNTDGTITSTVQANTDAGFSIVTYTGTGSISTVGHGLGVKPDVMILKNRDTSVRNWIVYHKDTAASTNYFLRLNTTDAKSYSGGRFNGTQPTSSVFTVGTSSQTNGNGDGIVAYCFVEKQGYSKFGKYVGNGNADGPFVYTGFKPAFLMVKRTDSTGSWQIKDSARNPSNLADKTLFPNLTNAEYSTFYFYDLLSNGFKVRGTDAELNASGGTYIYMAFAENPFTTSTGIPTTAR